MSAYYHAGQGVMRNEFVGILFAVGALLFAYQGYSRFEDCALNLAGVLALGIALELHCVDLSSNFARRIHHSMDIRISGPGAHRANGLLELAGGNALTGWPNNVARIHGSCDRCRAIRARRFTATAEEEHHSSRGPGLSDVNVRE